MTPRLEIRDEVLGEATSLRLLPGPMHLGHERGAYIRLRSRLVGQQHAVLHYDPERGILRACPRDGHSISADAGECCFPDALDLRAGETLRIHHYALHWVEDEPASARSTHQTDAANMARQAAITGYEPYHDACHRHVLDGREGMTARSIDPDQVEDIRQQTEGLVQRWVVAHPPSPMLARFAAARWLLHRLIDESLGAAASLPDREKRHIVRELTTQLNLDTAPSFAIRMTRLYAAGFEAVLARVDEMQVGLRLELAGLHFTESVADLVLEDGALTRYIRRPEAVEELMVVTPALIYIAHHGGIHRLPDQFPSEASLRAVVERLVIRAGRRIDAEQPVAEFRMPDGSRASAMGPPITTRSYALTIRRFPRTTMTLSDLVERGMVTATAARFLEAAVRARLNILISGGTGSGKTTLLTALLEFISANQRVLLAEDTPEIRIQRHDHWVGLCTAPGNSDGRGSFDLQQITKAALRARPDRFIIGEVRDAAAQDLLTAMGTGHPGSMGTLHADSATEAVTRLETMIAMGKRALEGRLVRTQIGRFVDLVVQVDKRPDGQRAVTEVTEIIKYDERLQRVVLEPIFRRSTSGRLFFTGRIPNAMPRLLQTGEVEVSDLLGWETSELVSDD